MQKKFATLLPEQVMRMKNKHPLVFRRGKKRRKEYGLKMIFAYKGLLQNTASPNW